MSVMSMVPSRYGNENNNGSLSRARLADTLRSLATLEEGVIAERVQTGQLQLARPYPLVERARIQDLGDELGPPPVQGTIDYGGLIDGTDKARPGSVLTPAEWEASIGRGRLPPGLVWLGAGYINGRLDFPLGLRTRNLLKRAIEADLPSSWGVSDSFDLVAAGPNLLGPMRTENPNFRSFGIYVELNDSALQFRPYNCRITLAPGPLPGTAFIALPGSSVKRNVPTNREMSIRVLSKNFGFSVTWGYIQGDANQAVGQFELADAPLIPDGPEYAYFGAITPGRTRGLGVAISGAPATVTGVCAPLCNSSYSAGFALGGVL